jgi:hypothetical protein
VIRPPDVSECDEPHERFTSPDDIGIVSRRPKKCNDILRRVENRGSVPIL